jgi:hypothetical protein
MTVAVGYLGYRKWPEPTRRKLTDSQKETLFTLLSQKPGKIAIRAVANGDDEAFDYAQQLFLVFLAAKWDVGTDVGSQLSGGPPPVSLRVEYMQGQEDTTDFLIAALKKTLGESTMIEKTLTRPGPDVFEVLVGRRPH